MAETSKTNTIMALINGNAGRVVLFVSCLVLFILQSGSIYTANNQGNYSVVSFTLAIFMLGLVSAVTQNPKHLEIVSTTPRHLSSTPMQLDSAVSCYCAPNPKLTSN
jgi:hypothetical protein